MTKVQVNTQYPDLGIELYIKRRKIMTNDEIKEFLRNEMLICKDYLSYLYCMYDCYGSNLPAYQELMVLYVSLEDSLINTLSVLMHKDDSSLNIYSLENLTSIPDDIKEASDYLWKNIRCKTVAHYDKDIEKYKDYPIPFEKIVDIINYLETILNNQPMYITVDNITQNAGEFKKRILL